MMFVVKDSLMHVAKEQTVDFARVNRLLEAGVKIDEEDNGGRTP